MNKLTDSLPPDSPRGAPDCDRDNALALLTKLRALKGVFTGLLGDEQTIQGMKRERKL